MIYLNNQFFSAYLILCSILLVSLSSTSAHGEQYQEIRLFGDAGFAPFEYLENGKPVGANIEFLEALEAEMDVPIHVELGQWRKSQQKVGVGQGVGLTMLTMNGKRKKLYDFTQPTFTMKFSMFVNARNVGVIDKNSLTKIKVAVKRGGAPRNIMETRYPEATLVLVDNVQEGFNRLSLGEVDVVMEEEWVGNYALYKMDLKGIQPIQPPLATNTAHLALRKGNLALLEKIDDAISQLKENGSMGHIADKWSGQKIMFFARDDISRYSSFAIAGLIAVIAFVSQIFLFRSREKSKRYALRLERINRDLQRSNAYLEEFAGVAAHDLQEPLRKIQIFSAMLQTKYGNEMEPKALDYLERIKNSGESMSQLVSELLVFSRVTSKEHPLELIDLNIILKETLIDLDLLLNETDTQIKVDELPTIQANRSQMKQLFTNLIRNAVKFRHPDRPLVVSITLEEEPDSGCGIEYKLMVSDNGIGFKPEFNERIFQVFERLHGKEYEGTGMGLAICRRIAERHGGKLLAEGIFGKGASFTLHFSS